MTQVATPAGVRRFAASFADPDTLDARLAALRAAELEGVCVPTRVEPAAGGVSAWYPAVDGLDVAQVVRESGPLPSAEVVWLGIGTARALASLHAAGLAHGDVSPANVMVSGAGVVLVDTLTGASPRERGTPGYAAPERAAQVGPAGDVYALGRTLAFAAGATADARLSAWLEPLMRVDPGERPPAREVAVALRACAEPSPIALGSVDPARAMRAAASAGPAASSGRLGRAASLTPRTSGSGLSASGSGLSAASRYAAAIGRTLRGWRHWARRVAVGASGQAAAVLRALPGVPAPGAAAQPRTLKRPAGRPWRRRRAAVRAAIAAAAAVLMGVAGVVAFHAYQAATPVPQPGYDPALPVRAERIADRPAAAATELTLARISAIAAGDHGSLLALSAPDSASARADAALAEQLAAGAVAFEGLEVEVLTAEVLSEVDNRATVAITYALSAHVRIEGQARHQVAQQRLVAELDLEWTATGWVVTRARPLS